MATRTAQLRTMACALAYVTLLAPGLPAGEVGKPDCVSNQGVPIASGGTNGVDSVFAADLDGDEDLDVLSASVNDDKISWFENDGGTVFTEHVITTNADGASSVYAGDLDGDEDLDVVSASTNDDTIAWYENDGSQPPRFIERSITNGARNALAVFIADVDGDGDNDVLSASFDDDTIAWYENDGTSPPSFNQVVVSTLADGAASVFAVDLFLDPDPEDETDNDDLELLSASRLDDTIAWYERSVLVIEDEETMETTEIVFYVKHVVDSSADGATSVFAIDLDGDEDADLLSAGNSDNKIAWYENDGADPPSFTKHVISATAQGASAVFAADLDGDTDFDVISTSETDNKVAWYENVAGSFGNPEDNQQIITDEALGAAAVYAVDLVAPAGVDVLVASSVKGAIASDDKIAIHVNDGLVSPTFSELLVSAGAVAPEALLVVDVDGLPGLDVVAANSVDDSVIWFASDGMDPPAFTTAVLTNDAPGAQDLFWADLDGDGVEDLLAALSGDDSIAWYKNEGGGNFADPDANRKNISSFNTDGASAVFAIDLDGDDDIDVLSASADDDRIAWYENLGLGDFGSPGNNQQIISATADGARDVYAVDIDDDMDIDVLSASANDARVVLYESDGAEDPTFTEVEITNRAFGARSVSAADMDQDDDLDIVVGSSTDDTISWFSKEECEEEVEEPEGSGEFITVTVTCYLEHFIGVADFVRSVVVADLDGDSDPDAVSASSGDDKIAWYQSNLTDQAPPEPEDPPLEPVFVERRISSVAESARDVAVADVNGDGALDVVSGFRFAIEWHEGNSTEICFGFDATGDAQVDGVELSLLGGAFGQICADPMDPEAEWWSGIDYNVDCVIDGDDLAIMTSSGIWGHSTDPEAEPDPNKPLCAFTCP